MKQAFTLIELLVVVAIISILAAILFPVASRAKELAKRTVALSHLRECGMGLAMYVQDTDYSSIPATRDAFNSALAQSPTCDPSDNWRIGCSGQLPAPMIGSFAVARMTAPFDSGDSSWQAYLQTSNPTLLVSIFHGTQPLLYADYENLPPLTPPAGHLPVDRVVRLYLDGSAKTTVAHVDYNADHGQLFNWYHTFTGSNN